MPALRPKPAVKAPALKLGAKPSQKRSVAGRPTAVRVEAINKAILIAARKHFLALGFENALIDKIAATANVSKRTLYARYPTKEALRVAVIIEELARLAERHDDQLGPRGGGLKANLRRKARGIMTSLHSADVRALDRLIGETMRVPQELAKLLIEKQQVTVDALIYEIVEGTRTQRVPPSDPARVANHMMAALFGWHTMNNKLADRSSLEDALAYADQVVELIWSGREAW